LFTNTGLTTGVKLSSGGTSWSSISDRRAKENIKSIGYGLAEVLQLNPTQYAYKGNNHENLGFIAQELVTVIPEIVDVPNDTSEYMSVRYTEMIPVLTKAIQELSAQNQQLAELLAKQQAELNGLKAQMGTSMLQE
jgi:hypothetical protein